MLMNVRQGRRWPKGGNSFGQETKGRPAPYGWRCSRRTVTRAQGRGLERMLRRPSKKDYGAAALWYEKALSINPRCCMTMFNYGVLLETILNRKPDAMKLYLAASDLGDEAAGRRAELLRKIMKDP
eukprot:PhF_6_TR36334/c1_g1_i1/m.53217